MLSEAGQSTVPPPVAPGLGEHRVSPGVSFAPVYTHAHTQGTLSRPAKGTMGPIIQIMANWPTGPGVQSRTQPRLRERASSLSASQDR